MDRAAAREGAIALGLLLVALAAPAAAQHDPAHPPIDCPLRAQGVDPARLRPFAEVADFIAFLERADRALWQKPDSVVAVLGLAGTKTVVGLGAGSGYFSFRFAKVLPKGRVIAAEIEPEMVRHIHHRAGGGRRQSRGEADPAG